MPNCPAGEKLHRKFMVLKRRRRKYNDRGMPVTAAYVAKLEANAFEEWDNHKKSCEICSHEEWRNTMGEGREGEI